MSSTSAVPDPTPTAWQRRLADAAAACYRPTGRFAWHFARGKLAGDPAFVGLLKLGLIPAGARILDLGCGRGLLASWLRAACALHAAGDWPRHWPAAPQMTTLRGIELHGRDVACARLALASQHLPPQGRAEVSRPAALACVFEEGDIRHADFGRADAVVILDVLHYLDHAAQDDVLRRVRISLAHGGILLLRVGDAAAGLRFRLSTWVDLVIARARARRAVRLHGRSLAEWVRALQAFGFTVDAIPMSEGTLFANVLLVARPAPLENKTDTRY